MYKLRVETNTDKNTEYYKQYLISHFNITKHIAILGVHLLSAREKTETASL